VANFQKGVDAIPIRFSRSALSRLARREKYDDAITWFDKAINTPGIPDQYKNIAVADKGRATQAKARRSNRLKQTRRL